MIKWKEFLGIMFYSLQHITLYCKSYHKKINPSHFNKDI